MPTVTTTPKWLLCFLFISGPRSFRVRTLIRCYEVANLPHLAAKWVTTVFPLAFNYLLIRTACDDKKVFQIGNVTFIFFHATCLQ